MFLHLPFKNIDSRHVSPLVIQKTAMFLQYNFPLEKCRYVSPLVLQKSVSLVSPLILEKTAVMFLHLSFRKVPLCFSTCSSKKCLSCFCTSFSHFFLHHKRVLDKFRWQHVKYWTLAMLLSFLVVTMCLRYIIHEAQPIVGQTNQCTCKTSKPNSNQSKTSIGFSSI